MKKASIRMIGIVVLLASTVGVAFAFRFARMRLDWFVPVNGAQLEINGRATKEVSLYRATGDRTMVLIRNDVNERQTYVMLGPGPGHLPEGFKGSIRRCDSVFVATPFFGFGDNEADCVSPAYKRDENREAIFSQRFIEFTADDGNRVRVAW